MGKGEEPRLPREIPNMVDPDSGFALALLMIPVMGFLGLIFSIGFKVGQGAGCG